MVIPLQWNEEITGEYTINDVSIFLFFLSLVYLEVFVYFVSDFS